MAHGHAMPAPVALPGVAKIVAVGSGKGGVGKTTVAVNLAIALSKLGQRVGLMDADVYGPNVPLMMGSSEQPKVGPGNTIEPNVLCRYLDRLRIATLKGETLVKFRKSMEKFSGGSDVSFSVVDYSKVLLSHFYSLLSVVPVTI